MGVPRRQQLKTRYVNYYGTLILYVITMLPFLGLYGVKQRLGDDLQLSYQTGAMLVLCAMVFMRARWIRVDLFSGLYVLFQGLIVLVTTINNGFSWGIVVSVCAGIFLVLPVQKDGLMIIKALAVIGIVAAFWNLLDMLMLGVQQQTQYFVGGKNSFSIFLVPVGFAVVINKLVRRGRIGEMEILFLLLIVVSVIWAGSAAGIVTVLAMIGALLLARRVKFKVSYVVLTMATVYIVLAFFAEVFVNSNRWFRVTQWLGKDVTLTSRFSIWDRVLEMLGENWLVGVGRGAEIKFVNAWGRTRISSEAHNFLLELLLEGGILGLVLFCGYFWLAVRKLDMNSKLYRVVLMANMVILVNGLAESVNNKMVVSIFIALANACSVRESTRKTTCRKVAVFPANILLAFVYLGDDDRNA